MADGPVAAPSRRRRRMAPAPVAASLGVSLVLAEVVVRLAFRYNTPDTVRENSLQYAPSSFARHVLKPDQRVRVDEAWGLRDGAEATGREYRINELGFRGPSFAVEKPPGVCRIAVLGGSAAFDIAADEGRDWPRLVEGELRRRGYRQVEVLNAAVPGYATFDSLGRLYSEIWLYSPDYVVLYHGWNDVKYFRALSARRPLSRLVAVYTEGDDPFQSYQGWWDRLLGHSQLYVKLRTRYLMWRLQPGLEGAGAVPDAASTYGRSGPGQLRLDLELLVDAARHIGAEPVLLTQASLLAPDNTPDERAKIAYRYQGLDHGALVRAMTEANEVVRAVARERGALLLDLAPELSGRPDLFFDQVHTTAAGSEEIARRLAELLAGPLSRGCGGV